MSEDFESLSFRARESKEPRAHGLYTLGEMCHKQPAKYREIPPSIFKSLAPGSLVKVVAFARNFPKPCPEELWLIVRKFDAKKRLYEGEVNTRTQRGDFHGVQVGDRLRFEAKHIVNVGLGVMAA